MRLSPNVCLAYLHIPPSGLTDFLDDTDSPTFYDRQFYPYVYVCFHSSRQCCWNAANSHPVNPSDASFVGQYRLWDGDGSMICNIPRSTALRTEHSVLSSLCHSHC